MNLINFTMHGKVHIQYMNLTHQFSVCVHAGSYMMVAGHSFVSNVLEGLLDNYLMLRGPGMHALQTNHK